MEPQSSLPHSQVPATCLYPQPAQSSPYPTSNFLKIHLNIILLMWKIRRAPNKASKGQIGFNWGFKCLILSSHLHLGLPRGLFPSGFPTKTMYMPLSSSTRATCPAHCQQNIKHINHVSRHNKDVRATV
jgi:hypothetical protein